jgi:PPOX class probable FMN-dependent enzyme
MNLTSTEDLREIYRPARGGAVDKVIDHLDSHCVDFLAKSPLFVLSTADAAGVCDGSPKGGEPGFAQALDRSRLGWADYSGNNRLDSFENVVDNDRVALLFLIPGLNETLRVNGTAELSTDPALCERFSVGGKPARVVAVVNVGEAYIHCAKALRRAGVWDTDSWLDAAEVPSGACILRDHAAIEADVEVIAEGYERDVEATLWNPGGSGAQAVRRDSPKL